MRATDRLRDDTRELHERVEAATDVVRRCRTMDGYRDLLRRTSACVQGIEAALAGVALSEAGLDFDARRKGARLADDLRTLGEAAVAPRDFAPPATVAEALGVVYVVEGSMLGARILLRTIESSLGLSATHGASYFAGYGDRTAAMWKEFEARADAWCGDDETRYAEALRGAQRAFAAFERELAGP